MPEGKSGVSGEKCATGTTNTWTRDENGELLEGYYYRQPQSEENLRSQLQMLFQHLQKPTALLTRCWGIQWKDRPKTGYTRASELSLKNTLMLFMSLDPFCQTITKPGLKNQPQLELLSATSCSWMTWLDDINALIHTTRNCSNNHRMSLGHFRMIIKRGKAIKNEGIAVPWEWKPWRSSRGKQKLPNPYTKQASPEKSAEWQGQRSGCQHPCPAQDTHDTMINCPQGVRRTLSSIRKCQKYYPK